MKECKQCKTEFEITDADRKFYDRISPVFGDKKFAIPEPVLCPQCRQQRRLAFRNERKLYQRQCDLTGKRIISVYAPDTPYKVYDQAEWWSDKWDPLKYGRNFDFSKNLNEQLKELYKEVPHVSLNTTNVENSYYTNYALNQKNSYLIFGAGNNEDCMYGKFVVGCKDVMDSLTVYSCELCYEGIASENCYNCKFFVNCRNCKDCILIEDCIACRNCIGCFGLQGKQYCIFNKQYSKEDYEKMSEKCDPLTSDKIKNLRTELEKLKADLPHCQSHIYASENCTGDSIYNSKNCLHAFDCKDCEDCKYISFSPKTVATQDCCFCAPEGDRFCYNICSTTDLESSMACFFVWYGSNIYYSLDCHHCHNIFACIGLKNKKYCILNKQYSKKEYEALVPKIIEHMQSTKEWGEYFPFDLSPFAYNETIAQEYYPLTKEKALAAKLKWRDEIINTPSASDLITPPDNIREVTDNICDKIFKCEMTGHNYKIIPQELDFYRKMGIPIPKICPDQRHYNRLKFHNSYQLYSRKCAKCSSDIQTIYNPDRPETVYCERCYLEEKY